MFRQARKHTVMRMTAISCVIIALALGFLAISGFGFIKLINGPTPAELFDGYDIKGQYVEIVMDWSVLDYAQVIESKNNREQVIASEYLVQLKNGNWIGVRVMKDKIALADKLTEESYAIMEGTSDEWPMGFKIRGTVIGMDHESVHYIEDELELGNTLTGRYGKGEVIHCIILADVVSADANNLISKDFSVPEIWMITSISVLGMIIAVILPIYGGMRLWKKDIIRYCSAATNPDAAYSRLQEFYDSAPNIGIIKMNRDWIMTNTGYVVRVMDIPHIVWVYPKVTKTKLYGVITTSKCSSLCFAMDNGKTIKINGPKSGIITAIKSIFENTDHVMIGYSEQIAHLYADGDYSAILAAAAEIRADSRDFSSK